MNAQRKPTAFKLEESAPKQQRANSGEPKKRAPRAVKVQSKVSIATAAEDPFDQEIAQLDQSVPQVRSPRKFRLGALFAASVGALLTLAVGLWAEQLIADFFARSQWLGWIATGLSAVAGFTLLAIAIREVASIMRLNSVEKFRKRAEAAIRQDDTRQARRLLGDLAGFTKSNPLTAEGRQNLKALEDDVIDAADLVAIAERELFTGLDRQAKALVLQSAKRVSVVTAVSPRALIDVGFVLFESGRLIRRISQLYGCKPGSIGFLKLVRDVAAHLAVTGSIAVGDSLVQQLIGHGLAAKLSARLGEGVVNGLMTVRIGIAAMETARPLPFNAIERPGMGEFLAALGGTTTGKKDAD